MSELNAPTLKVNRKLSGFLTKPQPIKVVLGGRGCIAADTVIDTPSGGVRVDEFLGGDVYALTDGGVCVVSAERPVRYDPEQLYRVRFSDGRQIECTGQHRFLTPLGWQPLSHVERERLLIYAYDHRQSSLEPDLPASPAGVQHCLRRLLGWMDDYYGYCHRYDLPPLLEGDTFQSLLRRLVDGQPHTSRILTHEDVREFWSTRSFSQFLYLLSSLTALLGAVVENYAGRGSDTCDRFSARLSELSAAARQFHGSRDPGPLIRTLSVFLLDRGILALLPDEIRKTVSGILQRGVLDTSWSDTFNGCHVGLQYISVVDVVATKRESYYDLFVPIYNNYLSNGIVNHNSGKSVGLTDMAVLRMATEHIDVYCLREFQDSIAESMHREFQASIGDRLKLAGWRITDTYVQAPGGGRTTYKGANRNPSSIQGATNYKLSLFGEAHTASKETIDRLLPTILRKPGHQCWFEANPQSSEDAFSQRFIVPYLEALDRDGVYEDDMHLIVRCNWRDNPWWNEEQERLRMWDYLNRSRAEYLWIWEGHFNDSVPNGLIQAEWFDACVDAHKKIGIVPRGARVAAHDPADSGDSKGYAMRHGWVVLRVEEKKDGDVNEGAHWACALANEDKVDCYTWDCDGLGLALGEQTARDFLGTTRLVSMFKGSEGPDNPDGIYDPGYGEVVDRKKVKDAVRNKRAQYYLELRDRIYRTYRAVAHGEMCDPDRLISFSSDIKVLSKLRAELCRMPIKPQVSGGRFDLYSKKEMRVHFRIASPNLGDSVMMLMRQYKRSDTPAAAVRRPQPIGVMGVGAGRNSKIGRY